MADQLVYNTRLFNPLFWHLIPLLRNPKIRYIYVEGGSSAAKTYTIAQALWYVMMVDSVNIMCFRRFQTHIKDSVYLSFKVSARGLELSRYLQFLEFLVRYQAEDTRVRFKGLDDEENIKGIEDYDFVYNNEWSQFTEKQWDQQRKRLRGRSNQKFICDWNPISQNLWQYTEWLDKDEWIDLPLTEPTAPTKYSSLNAEYAFKKINKKGDSVWFKVTYRDNYWIVGHPSGKGGFVDEHTLADFEYDRIHKPNLYRVYANGERGILRTGGEFWKQFNDLVHVKPVKYESGPVHVSVDENASPYVTVTLWQIHDRKPRKQIVQFAEVICRDPENNAPKAAAKLATYLKRIGHEDVVFFYGDASGGKRSTVDDNSKSFFDKFTEVLRKEGFTIINRVAKANPQVALSAAFINDIYENNLYDLEIIIGDSCKISIDDYVVVKEDENGAMAKPKVKDKDKGITYEPNGHCSDTKRYFIVKAFEALFNLYKARNKKGAKSYAASRA